MEDITLDPERDAYRAIDAGLDDYADDPQDFNTESGDYAVRVSTGRPDGSDFVREHSLNADNEDEAAQQAAEFQKNIQQELGEESALSKLRNSLTWD